jgi:hypothetical protein
MLEVIYLDREHGKFGRTASLHPFILKKITMNSSSTHFCRSPSAFQTKRYILDPSAIVIWIFIDATPRTWHDQCPRLISAGPTSEAQSLASLGGVVKRAEQNVKVRPHCSQRNDRPAIYQYDWLLSPRLEMPLQFPAYLIFCFFAEFDFRDIGAVQSMVMRS